jgi:hypothetical protein
MGNRDVARGSAADASNAKHCPSRNSFSGMPKTREQIASGDVLVPRGHRPPFTTAPVADSQRSSDPLSFITSARADSQRRWLPPSIFRDAMDDPYDLILGVFALVVTAVMLVAGELYLVTRPEPLETLTPPASIVTRPRVGPSSGARKSKALAPLAD